MPFIFKLIKIQLHRISWAFPHFKWTFLTFLRTSHSQYFWSERCSHNYSYGNIQYNLHYFPKNTCLKSCTSDIQMWSYIQNFEPHFDFINLTSAWYCLWDHYQITIMKSNYHNYCIKFLCPDLAGTCIWQLCIKHKQIRYCSVMNDNANKLWIPLPLPSNLLQLYRYISKEHYYPNTLVTTDQVYQFLVSELQSVFHM